MKYPAIAMLALAGCCFGTAFATERGTVTVYAAASLREAFEAAAPAFTAQTGFALRFDFAGSDALATQIVQGAPADVFASANPAQMERLREAGLLAGSQRIFARNRLVLIVPARNPARITALADVGRPGIRLIVAAPTVPAGAYARQVLQRIDPAGRAGANIVSNELDVKAVVTKVMLGEGDAGFAYATDVTPEVAKSLRAIAIRDDLAPATDYPIAALKNGPELAGGQAFVDFIRSKAGARFLRDRGFHIPK